MGDWNTWQLLLGALGIVAAVALVSLGLLRRRVRAALARRRGGTASPKRAWHAETVDPVARLRSPYRPEPLCRRCLAINPPGERPFFVCRLNEECGLLEDTPADRR